MLLESTAVRADSFAARTGWVVKPEGLCKGDLCVPAPDAERGDGTLDAQVLSRRLGMPLVHDEAHGVWALGPATAGGHTLESVELPDLTLPDRDGRAFSFSSLLGRKVIMVAWASW